MTSLPYRLEDLTDRRGAELGLEGRSAGREEERRELTAPADISRGEFRLARLITSPAAPAPTLRLPVRGPGAPVPDNQRSHLTYYF